MATTRIISMHINKGKTIAQCLKARVDYIENPEKTNGGELISSYACSPETADQEFLLARNEYMAITGRRIHNEVIAYQLRQSFKPGEVTPEEANRIGYELASLPTMTVGTCIITLSFARLRWIAHANSETSCVPARCWLS